MARPMYVCSFAQYDDVDIDLSRWEFDIEMASIGFKGKHSKITLDNYRAEMAAWMAAILYTYGWDEIVARFDVRTEISTDLFDEMFECYNDMRFIENMTFEHCDCED